MDIGLGGTRLVFVLAALATSVGWLVASGILYLARKPPEPPVGPRTLELGSESPAVANFLVNGFRVGDEALPATLLDLAAQNVVDVEQRGPGVFFIRLRTTADVSLSAYERRLLAHLGRRASGGVIPAEALTTGVEAESKRWRRGFESEVVSEAKGLGLSRDAVDSEAFTMLGAAALLPALLVWAASEFQAGLVVFLCALAVLGWVRARHPQRETAAGIDAASRWLGVRAELVANEQFATHTPITVELWDRLLAYGAALGVASASSRSLRLGAESDTRAWSAYGGAWREIRISYPRYWPPAWGVEPLLALAVAATTVVLSAVVLYAAGPSLVDAGVFGAVPLLVLGLLVIVGVAVVVMAASDWRTSVDVTGPVIRLRSFGDDKKRRYYAAIDDGSSREIRAFRMSARQYTELVQGDLVTVQVTPRLACVRWVIRASPAA